MPDISTIPFWGRGFRPFFLGAAAYAALDLLLWIAVHLGWLGSFPVTVTVGWHAHEMIYGFAMAVVSGFLLTAVANWTGWSPVRGYHLLGLFLLWLVGRLVMLWPDLPPYLVLTIESAFIPALAVSLFVPLYKTRNIRNYVFLMLLTMLFALDVHYLLLGEMRALHVAIIVLMVMISLVGGRIIPAFTVSALRQRGLELRNIDQPKLDRLALASWLVVAVLIWVGDAQGSLTALAAFAAATIHLLRMRHYHTAKALIDPLLWVLHVAYLWLIIGLLLLGVGAMGWISPAPIWHAFTVGALGSATLGMMSRVALGHTGRPLRCHPLIILAFWLIQISVLCRVVGILLMSEHYFMLLAVSGLCWSAAFMFYLLIYVPMLLRPRPDGNPA